MTERERFDEMGNASGRKRPKQMSPEELKHRLGSFSQADFANPDSLYWPGYVWSWNDRLSSVGIRRQLRTMNAWGARSPWPLPIPRGFRPLTMPTSMEPDYLTEDYLRLYAAMVEEMRRLGMRLWLYDDAGWPSGSVAGRLSREDPSLAQQFLERKILDSASARTMDVPGDAVAAFAISGDGTARQLPLGQTVALDLPGGRVEIYLRKYEDTTNPNVPPYVDLLNPRTTKRFIALTHEVYRKAIGRHFGSTVPILIADEMRVSWPHPTWTADLEEAFKREKGYDIRGKVRSLFGGERDEDKQVRIDFYDWWSRRFAKAFFATVRRWCRKNGLLFAAHLGGEDITEGSRVYGFGHVLRALRELDLPGVDTIWRQVFPGTRKAVEEHGEHWEQAANHHFAKFASSVARQEGKPWAFTESFAVYGSGLTLEQMKWVTDFMYARGLNLSTVGGAAISSKKHLIAGCRPMFLPVNPMARHMKSFHSYVARLGYALSLGKASVNAAVYLPIRDIWVGGTEAKAAADANDELARALLQSQRDFDFIDDDVLERATTKLDRGALKIGKMSYATVLVSRARWMSVGSKERLRQFSAQGGRLLWVEWDGESGFGNRASSAEALMQIKPVVAVEPACAQVRACKRAMKGSTLYFLTNEGDRTTEFTAHFAETKSLVILDPESGACMKPESAVRDADGWRLPLRLELAGSCVVLFTNEPLTLRRSPQGTGKPDLRALEGSWRSRRTRSYEIGPEDFAIRKIEEPWTPAELGDWQGKFGRGFSGDVEYRIAFRCTSGTSARALTLDLGEVKYACEVVLNGKALGRRAWRPFSFPVAGLLKETHNELVVHVTNTLANQYTYSEVLKRWPGNSLGPYHPKTLIFEADSLPSGLFGPVRLQG